MTDKTITKFSFFVIVSFVLAALAGSCSIPGVIDGGRAEPGASGEEFSAPFEAGIIASNELTESSGLAVSKCGKDTLWTHNDSGDGPFIYAIGVDGSVKGVWRVAGAKAVDWEDIAAGRSGDGCELFIGDIGDNGLKRDHVSVYVVDEPDPANAGKTERDAGVTSPSKEIRLTYPDGPHNAEALMFDQRTGDLYVITKSRDTPAAVYRAGSGALQHAGKDPLKMKKVADISLPAFPPGFVTGGDISQDGRRIILCDYYNAYEYSLGKDEADLSSVWAKTPAIIDVGDREQGESVAYSAEGNAIFLTSESKTGRSPLIKAKRN